VDGADRTETVTGFVKRISGFGRRRVGVGLGSGAETAA
jgi:hypothetical protein